MASPTRMITSILFLAFYFTTHLEGFSVDRVKRDDDQTIRSRFYRVGSLNFNSTLMPLATQHRKIACFFVFDKEASADLNNNLALANEYATQLAALASKYTAHANIVVTNAGTEIWANHDRIPFTVGDDVYSAMPNFLSQFQDYLNHTQGPLFGPIYAVGVLISYKTIVQGGYSQGPPCNTAGASLINYRQLPWSIGGLLAHELAHTLSVVHPFELPYLCQQFPALAFCQSPSLLASCTCDSAAYPPEQCLMTYQFGRASVNAPTYTTCDLQMMKYFSSNIPCLLK